MRLYFSQKTIKKIIYILIVCVSFSFLFFILEKNIYLLNDQRGLEIKDYLLKKDNYSIIIMGNSHSAYSFNPNILDDVLLEEKTLVLPTSGAGNPSLLYQLKNAIDLGQKPDIVIIEVFSFRLNDYDESLPMLMNYKLKSFIDVFRLLPDDEHNLGVSFLFGNVKWHRLLDILEKNYVYYQSMKKIEENALVLSRGYIYTEEIIPELEYKKALNVGAYPFDFEYREKIFIDIINLCQKNEIDVLLVRTPKINSLDSLDQYSLEFAKKYKLTYFDLNNKLLKEIDNPRVLFKDAYIDYYGKVNSHTNHYGAQYASLKLAQKLDELGYIDIDQNKFQKYWDEFTYQLSEIK